MKLLFMIVGDLSVAGILLSFLLMLAGWLYFVSQILTQVTTRPSLSPFWKKLIKRSAIGFGSSLIVFVIIVKISKLAGM